MDHGFDFSRWSLELIRKAIPWLNVQTDAGVCQLLKRLDIQYKMGRLTMSSPDPEYEAKYQRLKRLREEIAANDLEGIFLYGDEVSYTNEPTLAKTYAPQGSEQPKASQQPDQRRQARIVGVLEAETGEVEYMQAEKIGRTKLIAFYEKLVARWPDQRLYLVQDNWPVHFHPEVMAQLETQESPWEFWIPDNWPDNSEAVDHDGPLPIQIVQLPTYAPWLNPIEKLWRWLKQKLTHMHALADEWCKLKEKVSEFLNGFSDGSDDLLKYTGLYCG